MSHVAWSVCLCVGHTGELYKKAEPIVNRLGLTHVGPMNHELDGVQMHPPEPEGHFQEGCKPAHGNISTQGESACPAHATEERIQRHEG